MPAGRYTLKANVYNAYTSAQQFTSKLGFVPTSGTSYLSTKTSFTSSTWETDEVTFTLYEETEGVIQIGGTAVSGGSSSNAKLLIDNLTLSYENPFATTDDYSALNTALGDAANYTIGFEDGEYAPYNNVALAVAKSIDQSANNLQTDVQAATTALSGKTWTPNDGEVNAVNDGDFSEATTSSASGDANAELQKYGWTAANGLRLVYDNTNANGTQLTNGEKAVFMWGGTTAEYGATDGYTMPLEANTFYQLSFDYAGWDGANNDNSTYSLLDASGNGIAKTNLAAGTAAKEGFTTVTKIFKTGDEASNYVFQFTANGNSSLKNVLLKKAVITLDEAATEAPTAGVAKTVIYNRSFKQGWNSIVLPFDATLTELGASDAIEYTGTSNTTINFNTVTSLKANTPYMVYFDKAKTDATTFSGKTIAPSETLTTTDDNGQYNFVGTYVQKTGENSPITSNDYVVVTGGIQKAKGENTLKAFRAYFAAQTAQAKSLTFTIDGNVVTGVKAVELQNAVNDGAIYNLAGQRVSDSYKGVVIKNGKKYVK